jgi:hypothetical protein
MADFCVPVSWSKTDSFSLSVFSAGAAIFITLHFICLHLVRQDFTHPAHNICGKS